MILADNAERGGIQADGGLEGDLLDARGDAAGSDGFLSKVLHEPCDDEDGESGGFFIVERYAGRGCQTAPPR